MQIAKLLYNGLKIPLNYVKRSFDIIKGQLFYKLLAEKLLANGN